MTLGCEMSGFEAMPTNVIDEGTHISDVVPLQTPQTRQGEPIVLLVSYPSSSGSRVLAFVLILMSRPRAIVADVEFLQIVSVVQLACLLQLDFNPFQVPLLLGSDLHLVPDIFRAISSFWSRFPKSLFDIFFS